ncbi:hypothetical protein N752_28500 [Desulforamulus aquiferis]|nr:spore germination protein [Desulforamulus aquiferis]RYD01799.1 hypothetical protein N752_28500 [Desulforamulus aquiferis]
MLKWLAKQLVKSAEKKSELPGQSYRQQTVDADLDNVLSELKKSFGNTSDLVRRRLIIGMGAKGALVVYLENMVDKKIINEGIIAKLQEAPEDTIENPKLLAYSVLATPRIKVTTDFNKVVECILHGDTAIFVAGSDRAIIAGTVGYEKRSIQQPETEVNIEGPREALIESLGINITMIRRRLKNRNLRFEEITLGTRTSSTISVAYLQGITDPGILKEVKRRLETIDVDAITSLETLHEYISDSPMSVFPTVLKSERPESITSCLLEGRVAILLDGYPWAITVPATFAQFMQAGDDYYQNFYFATFVRWIRYISFIITLTLPSLYVALITHHWEMLPTDLALTIAGSREGTPFPVIVEALGMELTFELLREAGVRLPKAVGQAVSIVGALVIGQQAVEAGLISPGMVIVVAFTGIASFTLPSTRLQFPLDCCVFP